MKYTPKQIEKYNRQKYIAELEKISKNLFRMFRDANTDAENMASKLEQLKKKLDEKPPVYLDSEYLRQLKEYIVNIYEKICKSGTFDDKILDEMREGQMTALNRLQKLKNNTSYKKEKHRSEHHDGW
ncbi:MAG: hypothetical protein IE885_02560 [Campylobacterales bacterium]|nr:hypothetical protein [Campylobacterales bacterium]